MTSLLKRGPLSLWIALCILTSLFSWIGAISEGSATKALFFGGSLGCALGSIAATQTILSIMNVNSFTLFLIYLASSFSNILSLGFAIIGAEKDAFFVSIALSPIISVGTILRRHMF